MKKESPVNNTDLQTTNKHAPCLFCKSADNSFLSVEHIFPESLGNKEKILPKGVVCDRCNNEILSSLDAELLDFDPIKFLRTMNGVKSKKGKVPISSFKNIRIENPNEGTIYVDLQGSKNFQSHSSNRFDLKFQSNKKIDSVRLKLLARSLYKIGLELIYLDHGRDFTLSNRFDDVRNIILGKKDFNGYLLIGTNEDSLKTGVTYKFLEDNGIAVFDFNYLFIRILFDMEHRSMDLENGLKVGRFTVLKF